MFRPLGREVGSSFDVGLEEVPNRVVDFGTVEAMQYHSARFRGRRWLLDIFRLTRGQQQCKVCALGGYCTKGASSPVPCTSTKSPWPVITRFMSTAAAASSG